MKMRSNPYHIHNKFTAALLVLFMLCHQHGFSQDTTRRKTINITSTFKPSLKNTAKLNFNAEAPAIDTARPVLKYDLH